MLNVLVYFASWRPAKQFSTINYPEKKHSGFPENFLPWPLFDTVDLPKLDKNSVAQEKTDNML